MKSSFLDSPMCRAICPSPKRHLINLIKAQGLKTGLDVGCGETSVLSQLRGGGFRTTGVDGCSAMIESARARGLHDDYVLGDVRECATGAYDVVVMSHVIEHFPRDEAVSLLGKIEQIARHIIYIETPNGFVEQGALADNPLQRHYSGWFPHDFEGRGYTVLGVGLRNPKYEAFGGSRCWKAMVRSLERLTRALVFRRPQHAGTLAAIRLVDAQGNVRRV